LGSTEKDEGIGACSDKVGDIVVVGTTEGDLGGVGNIGNTDAFVAKFDASGTATWIHQFGTVNKETVTGMCLTVNIEFAF
jgi:hypothetical protein